MHYTICTYYNNFSSFGINKTNAQIEKLKKVQFVEGASAVRVSSLLLYCVHSSPDNNMQTQPYIQV